MTLKRSPGARMAELAGLAEAVAKRARCWIGPGRVRVAFLGAAQVNRHANLNSTVIGDSEHPRTQLPGAGGAPEIATGPQEVAVTEAPTREELGALRELAAR